MKSNIPIPKNHEKFAHAGDALRRRQTKDRICRILLSRRFPHSAFTTRSSLAVFRADDRPCRLFYSVRKTRPNAVGDTKQNLDFWVAQTSVHKAQHGLRHAATLGNSIIGKLSAHPLLSQTPNDFLTDRLVMQKPMHEPPVWQKWALDMYFSDVQHRRAGRRNWELKQREHLFTKLTPKGR